MQSLMNKLRSQYFQDIIKLVQPGNYQFVILTHILEDRPEFLAAIAAIAPIALVIAIPYSINQTTLNSLRKTYKLATPSLEQLKDSDYLHETLANNLGEDKPAILLEIGGYFAHALKNKNSKITERIIGIIEDTETGHREYEKIHTSLQIPVVSIARSPLKNAEDYLVGPSCVHSVEKILRRLGLLIYGKHSLILGFGKVGRGLAYVLARHNCPVMVYDIDPIRAANALSEGFKVLPRSLAFQDAEIIYGTTGTTSIKKEDFGLIKTGALLASCGSKDTEFDLRTLNQSYAKKPINDHLDCYKNGQHFFYLAANGRPINFIDGAVIGPALALTQAEIILAINDIIKLAAEHKQGLFETDHETKQLLARKWLECFCDEKSGRYRHVFNDEIINE